MRIEVLAIGDELLDGRVADTNTLRLAQFLEPWSARIVQRTTITDDVDVIVREARAIAARGTSLCFVSGGLGPTTDDVTAEGFAALCGTTLWRVPEQVARIEERLRDRGKPVSESHLRQAEIPKGSASINNRVGSALGFICQFENTRFISLPGVPSEFDAMVHDVLPTLLGDPHGERIIQKLRCFGLMEAEMDVRLAEHTQRYPEVRVGFRVKFPEIQVTLKGTPEDVANATAWAREQLAPHIFSDDEDMAQVVIRMLRARGETVAIAESCTGGQVADLLVSVPGASDVFKASVVAYANTAKMAFLGVSATILETDGAVSEACVRAMAEGVRVRAESTWGLAISGIAGPSGGSAEKPVGTVWYAIASINRCHAVKQHIPYGRAMLRTIAAYGALNMLRLYEEN